MSTQETEQPSTRPRSGALDAVRVLGIVAVVAGHVWDTQGVHEWLYPWHVPVFFFLSGYLWRPKLLRQEWTARWRSLGRPYLTWLVVLLIAVGIAGLAAHTFRLSTAEGPLYGGEHAVRPFTTFWFVSVLLMVSLLYRLVTALPRWVEVVALVVALGAAALYGPQLAATPLAVGSALPCLPFLIAGAAAARVHRSITKPAMVGVLLLVVSGGAIWAGLSAPVNIKLGDYGTPIVSMVVASAISFGLLLIAESVFSRLSLFASRAATALAGPGLVVVLLHPVVLWALQAPSVGNVGTFVLALLAPWAFGLVLVRTPAAVWAAGTAAIGKGRAGRVAAGRP